MRDGVGRGGTGRGVAGLVKRGVGGGAIFMRVTAEPTNISCAVFEKHSNIQEAYVASNARCTRERERERERVTLVGLGLFER